MENNEKSKHSPLLLGVARASWAAPINHGSELDNTKKLVEVRDKIFKRDNHTCQYCGWKSERFQEIHHKNHNHKDYREKNLITVCPLCHQNFHLSSASITEGGEIIWLPELTQEQLNQLCIAIFIAERSGNKKKWEGPAKRLFNALNSRSDFVNNNLADKASDPGIFAQTLLKMTEEQYNERHKFVKNLRLLPFPGRFTTQIDYWSTADYKNLPLDAWLDIIPKDFIN